MFQGECPMNNEASLVINIFFLLAAMIIVMILLGR